MRRDVAQLRANAADELLARECPAPVTQRGTQFGQDPSGTVRYVAAVLVDGMGQYVSGVHQLVASGGPALRPAVLVKHIHDGGPNHHSADHGQRVIESLSCGHGYPQWQPFLDFDWRRGEEEARRGFLSGELKLCEGQT